MLFQKTRKMVLGRVASVILQNGLNASRGQTVGKNNFVSITSNNYYKRYNIFPIVFITTVKSSQVN